MKRTTICVLAVAMLALGAGCEEGSSRGSGNSGSSGGGEGTVPSTTQAPAPPAGAGFRGEVTETMDSGGYTYLLVKHDGGETWVAATELQVAVGDRVTVPSGMVMLNFRSETLQREFEQIQFVASVQKEGQLTPSSLPSDHPSLAGRKSPTSRPTSRPDGLPSGHPPVDGVSGELGKETVDRVAGGSTIEELYSSRTKLAGTEVLVRGRVVKYNAGIMGRNWIHIRDGSGSAGSDDLTVTTNDVVKVGDLIVVKGTLAVDRDFTMGYRYDVIVEEASIKVE